MVVEQASTFGTHLRLYREAAGRSQEQLGERAGPAASAIEALECGQRRRPYPRTVQLLAEALGLTAYIHLAASSSPHSNVRRVTNAFVGRQNELVTLRAKLAEALARRGSVVILVDEAGICTTRLARESAHDAAFHGAAVLWGCRFEGDWQPPYGPWIEAPGSCVRARSAPFDGLSLRRRITLSVALGLAFVLRIFSLASMEGSREKGVVPA